jgi:hypothetical protein
MCCGFVMSRADIDDGHKMISIAHTINAIDLPLRRLLWPTMILRATEDVPVARLGLETTVAPSSHKTWRIGVTKSGEEFFKSHGDVSVSNPIL